MPKTRIRTYSPYTRAAVALLGEQVRAARLSQRLPVAEVAERVGTSRGFIQRLERGDLKVEIGLAFEVAFIVGVPLFEPQGKDDMALNLEGLNKQRSLMGQMLSLLPRSAHPEKAELRDDF
ncbi:helix-turn-helix domain-containing protein [Hydrocarboniclastica marina]|uniref:XRE family transcriptional regulator n=1 Tax=Hydrocarboniclastica marina TaxID=2259620 RepID=A0A4P7XMT4_9ALTE|nr:helix-turn-helix transcriptional regulator [Hydrocarboniclastica marina]QCF27507.1 XRE family transcriptional regulator [Hydrocarboniclastica marina]